jgi:hypothetical protein
VDLKKNNLAALQELRDVFSRHKEYLPLPGEAYNPFSQEASCFLFFQDRAMILFFSYPSTPPSPHWRQEAYPKAGFPKAMKVFLWASIDSFL